MSHYLHIVQLYHGASGAARYFIEIGERLVRDGHQVTVLTTDAFDLEHLWAAGKRRIDTAEEYINGVKVIRLPVKRIAGPSIMYPIIRRSMVELGRLPKVNNLLRSMAQITPQLPDLRSVLERPEFENVTIVHTTNITLDFMILPVVEWAKQRGIPHICTPFIHLGEPNDPGYVRYYSMPHMIELLKECEMVITQTNLEMSFLRRRGVPQDNMRTIGVGVNLSEIRGGDGKRFREQQNIRDAMVLTLGTAAADKGTIHTVEAMRMLWKAGRKIIWVQVGPQMEHFTQYIQKLTPEEKAMTRVLGFVDDQTRRDALAAANLMVMPSRTDSFGIVYLEAWCYAVPVIGARAGGVPEVILDGENGVLVPFGNVSSLSQAILNLLRDRDLARAMGQIGQRRVEREFTWDSRYFLMRSLYRNVEQNVKARNTARV